MTNNSYEGLLAKVLGDNHLSDTVRYFVKSHDWVHYVDRHVLDITPESNGIVQNAVRLGLALLDKWSEEIRVMEAGVFFSEPLLIIDDEWLELDKNAPPPHILLTIAKGPAQIEEPRGYFSMYMMTDWPRALDGDICDTSASMGLHLYRVPEGEDKGAWVFAK